MTTSKAALRKALRDLDEIIKLTKAKPRGKKMAAIRMTKALLSFTAMNLDFIMREKVKFILSECGMMKILEEDYLADCAKRAQGLPKSGGYEKADTTFYRTCERCGLSGRMIQTRREGETFFVHKSCTLPGETF